MRMKGGNEERKSSEEGKETEEREMEGEDNKTKKTTV